MKKIICIFICCITLCSFCFASSASVFSDFSFDISSFVPVTVTSKYDSYNSYVLVRKDKSDWCPYLYNQFTVGDLILYCSDSSVNLSSNCQFTCNYIYIYHSDGTLIYSEAFTTPYTNYSTTDLTSFSILSYNNLSFNGFLVNSESAEDHEYKSGVLGWFQRLFNKIGDIGSSISNGVNSIGAFFTNLFDKIDYLFNPFSQQFDVGFGDYLSYSISQNLDCFDEFQSAVSNFKNLNTPLDINGDLTFGSYTVHFGLLDNSVVLTFLTAFDPYRLRIRSGISTIFYVAALLCVIRMICHLFGISFGGSSGAGSVVRDSVNNISDDVHYSSIQSNADSLNDKLDRM